MSQPESKNAVRSWINKRSAIITILSVVAIAASLVVIYYMLRPTPIPITYAYYYDLGTNKVFTDIGDRLVPFQSPSGKTGPKGEPLAVRAFVFSCSNCDDPNERQLAYIGQYSPHAFRLIEEMNRDPEHAPKYSMEEDPRNTGMVFRAAAGGEWFMTNTEGADEITAESRSRCKGGSLPALCFPEKN